MKPGQRMPFEDALAITPDDLPDGAYFALAHEIAGLEYGDGFDELGPGTPDNYVYRPPVYDPVKLRCCHRKFKKASDLAQHRRDKHGDKKEDRP